MLFGNFAQVILSGLSCQAVSIGVADAPLSETHPRLSHMHRGHITLLPPGRQSRRLVGIQCFHL
jgi:hypothetical protein